MLVISPQPNYTWTKTPPGFSHIIRGEIFLKFMYNLTYVSRTLYHCGGLYIKKNNELVISFTKEQNSVSI